MSDGLVIKNCKFIRELTEGTDTVFGDVYVKDGMIEAILPCGTVSEGGDFQVFDIGGATLMPGMIDAHVHLYMSKNADECANIYPGDRVFECYRYAKEFLEYGYTTLRDAGDTEEYPTVHLGRAIESGLLEGPEIIPCGLTLVPYLQGTDVSIWKYTTCEVSGPMEVRLGVRKNLKRGAQFIKLYGSGSMICPGTVPGRRILFDDEIIAAVEAAEMQGSYVAIHAHGAEAAEQAFRCGVRTVEHATLISHETVDYVKGLKRLAGIVPTLSIFTQIMNPDWNYPDAEKYARQAKEMFEVCLDAMKYAYNKGILMGFGTDLFMDEFLKDPFGELRIRKEKFGFAGIDILRQATIQNALLIGRDDVIGTIKTGKRADMLVIDGDPAQDFSVMYKKPMHIIKGGKIVR